MDSVGLSSTVTIPQVPVPLEREGVGSLAGKDGVAEPQATTPAIMQKSPMRMRMQRC